MSEKEELKKAIESLESREEPNCVSAFGGINVDDLYSAVERLKKIPNYNDLLKENKQLKEQIKYKEELIKEIVRNVNNDAFEVYTKEYGNINVVEVNAVLETKIRRNK